MKKITIALTLLVLFVASPAAADTDIEADEINCTGTPTNNQVIDGIYQGSCSIVASVCSVFDPCPI